MRAASIALAGALLGSCLEGSAGLPAGARCEGDDDCADGLACRFGRCRAECVIDRDCDEGLRCVVAEDGLGVCELPDEEGCGDVDCPAGQVCVDGACAPVAGGDGDGDADPDAEAGTDAEVDAGEDAAAGDADLDYDRGDAPWGGNPAGSVIGDDLHDLVVLSGEPGGAVYVFAGSPGFGPARAEDRDAVIRGTAACSIERLHGYADANADGLTDVLLGTACDDATTVVAVEGPLPAGELSLDAFPRRFVIASPGGLPPHLLGVGDYDHDGLADLVATFPEAPNAEGNVVGRVHLYSDLAAAGSRPTPDTVIEGVDHEDRYRFGGAINPVGADVTGDGGDDLVVGASIGRTGDSYKDAAYLFDGPLPVGFHGAADLYLVVVPGDNGVGPGSIHAGRSAAVADVDQDGALDLLIGADGDETFGNDAGRVYVYRGPVDVPRGTVFEPRQRDAEWPTGYDWYVSGRYHDEVGRVVHGTGDLDGDGWLDVLVWGPDSRDCEPWDCGVVFGVFSAPGFQSRNPPSRDPPHVDFAVWGDHGMAHWGPPAVAGDLDGDGCDDWVVGHGPWSEGQGAVFVFFGCGGLGIDVAASRASLVADLVVPGPAAAGLFGAEVLGR